MNRIQVIEKFLKRCLGIKHLIHERDQLRLEIVRLQEREPFVPAGHFYSPIPAIEDIKNHELEIWGSLPRQIEGIDLREDAQADLLNIFETYYRDQPFFSKDSHMLRFVVENREYPYPDAFSLYCMIRYVQPKRIIEIGSGHSSCLMLDTNERYFDNTIQLTCIDPFPELLLSLIRQHDVERIRLFPQKLQEVKSELFTSLQAGDILFIDSTHVCKIYSDVASIFSSILPQLNSGVYIHFHDIFYPFEYPKEWIYQGRAWNEAYVLRAFLQYNTAFEIIFFNTFLEHFYRNRFVHNMPRCLQQPRIGGSLWIRKK